MSLYGVSLRSSNASGFGVTSVNGLTGAITIAGTNHIGVSVSGQTITISDSGLATTSLNNLASTAVNASIVPATHNVTNLGSASKNYATTYSRSISATGALALISTNGINIATTPGIAVTITASPLQLIAATSGSVSLSPATSGADYSLVFPNAQGGVNTVPLNDGSGNLSWVAAGSGGIGTVTSVSVVSANGFAGTVATATTTPAITISTTINAPVLAGNGTAISAATTTGSGSTVVLATAPSITSPDLGSTQIHSVADPSAAQDAATKAYVDAGLAALNPAAAVFAASVANVPSSYLNGVAGVGATLTTTSTATFTLDGTTPALGARILFKDQSPGLQNGIYTFTTAPVAGVLGAIFTRALDYDTPSDMNVAGLIPVQNGTVNALSSWQQIAIITTIGTDAPTFSEFTANPSLYLLKANNLNDLASASTSFNNISGLTALGDLIYGGAAGTRSRLAGNITTTLQVLTQTGNGSVSAAPVWTNSTGTGNAVFSASPTLTGTLSGSAGSFSSTLSASNLSGTNTGDQTITLTGDVTGSGTGSFAATIAANAVTYAKFQQVAASSIVGNATGSLANATGITLGATLAFSGSALQTAAHTGDITTPANSFVTTLATVNANTGSFGSSTAIPSFTVNGKGLITAASTNAVIAPAGTLTGTTLAATVVTSSLTSVGTITTGVWTGTTIAIANGGTGQTTATAAFDALSPMTTSGDTIYGGASGTRTRLAGSTSATLAVLTQTGNGSISAAPVWTSSTGTGNVVLSAAPTLTGTTNVGSLLAASQLAAGAIDANSILTVGGGTNPLSGTSQVAVNVNYTSTAAATTMRGVYANISPNAGASVGFLGNFWAGGIGTASTPTRVVDFYTAGAQLHRGTNNASLADNSAFTGSFFLHQTGTDSSVLKGALVLQALTTAGPVQTDASGNLSSSATLPLANGGTGQATKAPAFDALQPMTTAGDTIYGGTSGTGTRLAGQTTLAKKQLCQTNAAAPVWAYTQSVNATAKTGTYAIVLGDSILYYNPSGGAFTTTMPDPTTCSGQEFTLVCTATGTSANLLTIAANGSETFGAGALSALHMSTVGEAYVLVSDGTNWVISQHRTATSPVTATMTLFGATANPTKGTVTVDRMTWDRAGKMMHIQWYYVQTAAGTGGTGVVGFTIPLFAADTTAQPASTTAFTAVGVGTFNFPGWLVGTNTIGLYDSTRLCSTNGTAGAPTTSGNGPNFGATGTSYMMLEAWIPISNWEA